MTQRVCNYANCLEDVGDRGLTITLKTPDSYEQKRAIYCCAAHAAAALARLAIDRREPETETPNTWKVT